jgi:hypothetical protein
MITRARGDKREKRKSVGQSLVEFTLMLPVLLMMISGVIELGFMLNFYLDLVDAAREVARSAADDDPVHDESGFFNDDPTNDPEPKGFYIRAWDAAYTELKGARQITLSQANLDDLVISIFSVSEGSPPTVMRYPTAYTGMCPQGGELGWRLYCNKASKFSIDDVKGLLNPGARTTGLVMVEIYYNYNLVMGLPWIEVFLGDPILLHAYSIMPNRHAAP